MPGLSSDQKKAKLARMSYADYLTNLVKVDPKVVDVLQSGSETALWCGH